MRFFLAAPFLLGLLVSPGILGHYNGSILEHYLEYSPSQTSGSAIDRIDLDITGDAEPELFLSRSGYNWLVYSPNSEGFAYLGQVQLYSKSFRYVQDQEEIVAVLPGGSGKVHVVRYQVGVEGVLEIDRAEIDQYGERAALEAEAQVQYYEGTQYPIVRASTKDLLAAREGFAEVWLDVTTRRPVRGLRRVVDALEPEEATLLDFRPDSVWGGRRTLLGHFVWFAEVQESGDIFVLAVDLTGDGRDELFLNQGGFRSQWWHLYSPVEGGYKYYGEIDTGAGFRVTDNALMVRREGRLRRSTVDFVTYEVGPAGLVELETVTWDKDRDYYQYLDAIAPFGSWLEREGSRIKIGYGSPSEALEGSAVSWFHYGQAGGWQERLSGQRINLDIDFEARVVEVLDETEAEPTQSRASGADSATASAQDSQERNSSSPPQEAPR